MTRGASYTISGQQFNGVSQGCYYGDDFASATNFPIVRFTNQHTGHVFYARSYGFSYMGVQSSKTGEHAAGCSATHGNWQSFNGGCGERHCFAGDDSHDSIKVMCPEANKS